MPSPAPPPSAPRPGPYGRRGARTGRKGDLSTAERDRLQLAYPEIFKDGAICGFVRHFAGERGKEGYPRGFHHWPSERRSAWRAGFGVGFHDWLNNRYPEFEQRLRQTLIAAASRRFGGRR
jgi:hypothetical protein